MYLAFFGEKDLEATGDGVFHVSKMGGSPDGVPFSVNAEWGALESD
jgi:hypothetical protein